MGDLNSLFTYKIFEQKCTSTLLSFVEEFNTEYYNICLITDDERLFFESEPKPINEYWMQLFDSRRDGDINELMVTLEAFEHDMYLGDKNGLIQLSSKSMKAEIQQSISRYKDVVALYPAFLAMHKPIHNYIYAMVQVLEQDRCKTDVLSLLETAQSTLHWAAQGFIQQYKEYDRYVFDCLVMPHQDCKMLSTGFVVATYEKWRTLHNEEKSISIYPNDNGLGWYSLIHDLQEEESISINFGGEKTVVVDHDFRKQFIKGIRYFIDNNLILRICPVCQRYFATKSALQIKYCTREFREGKTCQEIGTRNTYIAKKSTDPIHAAYLSEYNKRYARVRRKTATLEEARIIEIRKLRVEYQQKYHLSESEQSQAEILEEFKAAMKNL